MSKYEENVDKINADTEKNDILNNRLTKAYIVICAVYLIPCIIQIIVSVSAYAAADMVVLALIALGGFMSCHSRNNKWCILTALGTIYSIGFGFDNDTFIEKLIYRIGWSNFEINSLLFVPVTLLILLTFYSNQKHKELLVQNSKYVERYREKELRQKRMESGEQKLREMRVQESGKLNGEMAEAGAPDSGNISGKKDSGKSSYMDDI